MTEEQQPMGWENEILKGLLNALGQEVGRFADRLAAIERTAGIEGPAYQTTISMLGSFENRLIEHTSYTSQQIININECGVNQSQALGAICDALTDAHKKLDALAKAAENDHITLNVICEHQLKIEERFLAATRAIEEKLDEVLVAVDRLKQKRGRK